MHASTDISKKLLMWALQKYACCSTCFAAAFSEDLLVLGFGIVSILAIMMTSVGWNTFVSKTFNQKSWKLSSYGLMSKPGLHVLAVLQSSSKFRGPTCAGISSLRKTDVLFTDEKFGLFQMCFFKSWHSCRAVMNRRENKYIACYLFRDLGE